jgi:hypothetical protein
MPNPLTTFKTSDSLWGGIPANTSLLPLTHGLALLIRPLYGCIKNNFPRWSE